jgi:PPM family protein phosphatase
VALGTRSGGCSRAGDRGPNEDALAYDDARRLFAVADGVGQYRGAAVASALVIDSARAALASDPPSLQDVRAWLGRAAGRAARDLHARGKAEPTLGSMAAALTLVVLVDDAWWALHVGDARAYLLRGGQLAQLTRDHSIAWEQLEAGAITKAQLRDHPNQKLLTRTLIARRDVVVPDIVTRPAQAGDRLLLCTDGVSKVLDDDALQAALAAGDDPAAIAADVVARVAAVGLKDDTTVVVVIAA